MTEILRPIYIEKDEGVGSVLTRVQQTSEKKIALVFPPQSAIFQNVLEVEFLKKELDQLGKEVIIITSDKAQAELAKGLGFSSSESLREGEGTNKFLQDFYSSEEKEDKSRKLASPLIKPKISDIKQPSSQPLKKEESLKIEINAPEQKFQKEEAADLSKSIDTSLQGETSEEKETAINSSKITPISFAEDAQAQEEAKPSAHKKLHFPKFSFNIPFKRLTAAPFKKILLIFLLAAVGVFIVAATFVFPRADITVLPAREKAQLNIDVSFDTSIKAVDFEKNIIPSQIFQITKTISQEFAATKQANIEKKARGTITIYNAYSSDPQTLVKTTRFRSPDGKIFRITKTITVPGAQIKGGTIVPSSIDVEVVADQPGEAYNIGPTQFTIPGFQGTDKYKGFYGKSKQAMKGGLIKKGLVVGEDDIAKAVKTLKDKILAAAEKELKKQPQSGFEIIGPSLNTKIIETKAIPPAGDPAEKFTLTLKAKAQVFAYKKKDLNDLIEEKIALKISDKRLSLPDTQKLAFTSEGVNFDQGKADFNLLVTEDISWKIAQDRLKEVLAGKNEIEAQAAIKLFSEINAVRVSLWPFWIKHIPKDVRKINVRVDYS